MAMRIDYSRNQLRTQWPAVVAAVLVAGMVFVASGSRFSNSDLVADVANKARANSEERDASATRSAAALQDTHPALLERVLRNLGEMALHG
jgi:hypothetical protein